MGLGGDFGAMGLSSAVGAETGPQEHQPETGRASDSGEPGAAMFAMGCVRGSRGPAHRTIESLSGHN